VDGTTIEVSQHNPPLEDIAQALTDSLPRDGSAPMTGSLPMGGNKITGGAVGTNPTDFAIVSQLPTFTPTTATLTAGTNAQGQGPITTDQVTITVAAANPSGATLPTAVAGKRVIIANRGANPVNIYPETGAAIGALAANAPVLLAVNQSVEFFARSATQWEGQISQPLDADLSAISALTGTGLLARTGAGTYVERTITSTDGSVTITNPGGVAGNVNLSAPGGGAWTTTGTTSIASGTSGDVVVPSSATQMVIEVVNLSLSGPDDCYLRLLDGGVAKTTGYTGFGLFDYASAQPNTAGFRVRLGGSSRIASGQITLDLDTSLNVWRIGGVLVETSVGVSLLTFAGYCTNVTTLSGIRLLPITGNFDGASGTIQVTYR